MALTCHLVLLKVQEKLQFAPRQLHLELRVLYCWGLGRYGVHVYIRQTFIQEVYDQDFSSCMERWYIDNLVCVRDQNFTV